jgi:hypothetical protein
MAKMPFSESKFILEVAFLPFSANWQYVTWFYT